MSGNQQMMMGQGSSGSAYDSEAQAYFNAIVANSGTISTASKGYINTFVLAAKSHSYWTKMYIFAPFVGDQLLAALVGFKPSAATTVTMTNGNFVSGDYSEATGLLGNGTTKYIDTGVLDTTATANSTHLMAYNRSSSSNGGRHGVSAAGGIFEIYAPYSDSSFYSDQYDSANGRAKSNPMATPYGFLVGSRTASNSHHVYRNGSDITTAGSGTSGGTLAGLNVYIFAVNTGSGAGAWADCRLAAFSFGSGLTSSDVSNFSTDLNALQTSLGRNTY